MDTLTKKERSDRMRLIGPRDTKPEMMVRRIVTGLGHRYRLHVSRLPGCPDLVFFNRRKVIFVHGCFWHRHARCGRMPKSRVEFWRRKLTENRLRDQRNQRKLRKLGWSVLVVWECELGKPDAVRDRIKAFLEGIA